MVTTNFRSSFLEEKVEGEEGVTISEEGGELKAFRDSRDLTSFYRMSDVVTNTVDAFGLTVEETVDFDNRLDDFGGKRQFTDRISKTAEKYGESYDQELVDKLVDQIRVEKENFSAGNDLWNFLQKPEADLLAENAGQKLRDIINPIGASSIEDQIEEELDGEYQEAAKNAYQEHEEDFAKIENLSTISGREASLDSFDTFKWLKDKQYNPNWDQDLDMVEINRSLGSEIDTQVRSKTLDALKSQAHSVAAEIYEDIAGQPPEEVTEEIIYGARAWLMTEDPEIKDMLEDIIENDVGAYFSSNPQDVSGVEYNHLDILQNGLGTQTYEVDGREVDIHVATPMERLRYGEEFRTCKSMTWEGDQESNREVVMRSTFIKNPILYAETEGENGENVVGREILHYSLDGDFRELSDGRMYRGLESVEHNKELKEVMNGYKEKMRTELAVPTVEQRSEISDADIRYKVSDEWYAPEKAPLI